MKALTSILAALAVLTSLTFMACGSESDAPAPQTAIPEAQPDPCKGAVVVTADSLGNILNAEMKCSEACDGACTVRVKADDQGNTRSCVVAMTASRLSATSCSTSLQTARRVGSALLPKTAWFLKTSKWWTETR